MRIPSAPGKHLARITDWNVVNLARAIAIAADAFPAARYRQSMIR
jgi:hypothetical protein